MSKKTLFGCESIIPNYVMLFNEAQENFIYDKTTETIKMYMPHIEIDKEKLKKWVEMCGQLEMYTSQLNREERIVIEARLFNKLRWWQIAQIVPCSIGQVRRYYDFGIDLLERGEHGN